MGYHDIDRAFRRQGLRLRGGFDLRDSNRPQTEGKARNGAECYDPSRLPCLNGQAPVTLLLVGAVGGEFWPAFSRSPEYLTGQDHALDRWSERLIKATAQEWNGQALFPSDGPPYQPFQLWARLSETVFSSPLGLLVHPEWGVWHAYRGALLLPLSLPDLPQKPENVVSPCLSCEAKPCLTSCPVGAFSPEGYDVERCAEHLQSDDLAGCLQKSCAARRACPLGRDHHYDSQQTAFFMSAFLESRPR